jgi:hypothetical protein
MQRRPASGGRLLAGIPGLECQINDLLRCKMTIAAMQTSPLSLVSGIHKFSLAHEAEWFRHQEKGTIMSKTASIGLVPSTTLFGRLMASIDRLLTASSRIAVRNGDLPYFGL